MKSSKKICIFRCLVFQHRGHRSSGYPCHSTPLLDAGYDIRIIDSTITPDYKKRILEEVKDSSVPGHFSGYRPHDPRDGGCREGDQEVGS